jgi:hypothetical protein
LHAHEFARFREHGLHQQMLRRVETGEFVGHKVGKESALRLEI